MHATLMSLILLMAAAVSAQSIEVTGLAVCKGIENRACLEPVESVPADTPALYCLVTLKASEAGTLKHRWLLDGKAMLEIEVPVKFASPLYRQWSQKNLHGRTGNWTVEVVAGDGTVLKTIAFAVE